MKIPSEYAEYFTGDGPREGELTVNPYWYILWPPSEIEEMNTGYQVPIYATEYCGFGSSGGGEMLAFDKNYRIYAIPFIGMSPKEAILVADSWNEFLGLIKKDQEK